MINIPIWALLAGFFIIASVSAISGFIMCSIIVTGRMSDNE